MLFHSYGAIKCNKGEVTENINALCLRIFCLWLVKLLTVQRPDIKSLIPSVW